ncbi:hypothetical protein AAF712_010486 [Marasmius tenuissimus]|uniref:Transcription elongation factor Eaf N-terminal domain-containing protein n=1 Tax=Marasmius tenuissimus TaxID=585030 RepID=A0ABR2ZNZ7_9AGAR
MASTTWTPGPGRHKVNVGSSLTRALKARKGNQPPQKSNKLPDRDFYALRYNFKPSSIDSTKSGNMEVKRNKDGPNSSIIVEHPAQPSGAHVYKGREDPAKEWACVLIFDEETGSYTLEKLESFVSLEHVEKRAESLTQPAPSPLPTTTERSTRDLPEKQDGDLDSDFAEILPEELVSRPTKEDSEEDIPIQQTVPSRPPPAPRSTQPAPKVRPKLPAKPPPSSTSSKPKKAPKRSTPEFSDPEDIVHVPKPAPTTSKRARPSPPPPAPAKAPAPQPPAATKPPPTKRAPARKQPSPPPPRARAALELPGAGPSFLPGAPLPSSSSSSSRQPPSLSLPPVTAAVPPVAEEPPAPVPASDSEEDEEWDEVAAPPGVSTNLTMIEETPGLDDIHHHEVENEAGEEIDMDDFADLLNEQLGDEGAGDAPVEEEDAGFGLFPDSPEPQHEELPMPVPRPGVGPISMNAYVGGVDDEEEYSSSDESDDD